MRSLLKIFITGKSFENFKNLLECTRLHLVKETFVATFVACVQSSGKNTNISGSIPEVMKFLNCLSVGEVSTEFGIRHTVSLNVHF